MVSCFFLTHSVFGPIVCPARARVNVTVTGPAKAWEVLEAPPTY